MKPRFLVTDLQHFADIDDPFLDVPAPARRLGLQLGRIVAEISSLPAGRSAALEVRCRRRPGRRPCPGPILAQRSEVPDEVCWVCTGCEEEGVIRGWRGTPWDRSRAPRAGDGEAAAQPGERTLHVLELSLLHIEPQIWRRVQVPSRIGLDRLHRVIQRAMGWTDSHLHLFLIDGKRYGMPDPDDELGLRDERRVRLDRVAPRTGDEFLYEYDFGDGWLHRVRVESVEEGAGAPAIVRCLGGARACPPEDVGGPPGYLDFLAAVLDPRHPEHRDTLRWAGGAFDPERFDPKAVDATLRRFRVA